jgi:hypothetical protein
MRDGPRLAAPLAAIGPEKPNLRGPAQMTEEIEIDDIAKALSFTREERAVHAKFVRLSRARKAPKSTLEARLALFIAEQGITDAELKPFYKVRRKGARPRFDYHDFAERYEIEHDWLWSGSLEALRRMKLKQPSPRMLKDRLQRAQDRELKESLSNVPCQHKHEMLACARKIAAREQANFDEKIKAMERAKSSPPV